MGRPVHGEEPVEFEQDVSAYALSLQAALRNVERGGNPSEWRTLVERGLGEAYRQRDPLGLVAMIQVVVSILDATGHHAAAVDELDYAVEVADGNRDAVAMLESLRACYLAGLGHVEPALQAVAAARAAAAQASIGHAIGKTKAHAMAVELMALVEVPSAEVERLVRSSGDQVREGDSLFLASYQIPYLYALGDRAKAAPRLRAFQLAAQAANHPYRLEDWAVFNAASKAVAGPLAAPAPFAASSRNWLARWRNQLLRLRAAMLDGAARSAPAELDALAAALELAGDAGLGGLDPFQALYTARSRGGFGPAELEPPERAHLLNLAAIFAGAEAVAIAGSQAMAATWGAWLREHLPSRIHTCLEWPVSRARVEALLALRAGDLGAAALLFDRAAAWAASAGYSCELATISVQQAEFLLHHGARPGHLGAQAAEQREAAWEDLRERGIDPSPFAYDVARLSAWTRDRALNPHLTKRETEVIMLLADDLSYKAIAERLGIRWPTVQATAHSCYMKLGVSGKKSAIAAARDRGIL